MSGCEGYEVLPHVYERLNAEIDYDKWADFVEACFARFLAGKPELVLDLACGTGSMTRALAKKGYDMIGVDGSENMLSEAYSKSPEAGILYLLQDMRSFELYGTVGAVVCCLDSINYLLSPEDVKKTFAGVHNYLDPDGLFLFDVNSLCKFRTVYGDQAYILEDEMPPDGRLIYCGWQNQYDEASGICDFFLTLFEEMPDGSYRRSEEHQRERCYSPEELKKWLEDSGFEVLGVYAGYDFSEPSENSERLYFAARAKK